MLGRDRCHARIALREDRAQGVVVERARAVSSRSFHPVDRARSYSFPPRPTSRQIDSRRTRRSWGSELCARAARAEMADRRLLEVPAVVRTPAITRTTRGENVCRSSRRIRPTCVELSPGRLRLTTSSPVARAISAGSWWWRPIRTEWSRRRRRPRPTPAGRGRVLYGAPARRRSARRSGTRPRGAERQHEHADQLQSRSGHAADVRAALRDLRHGGELSASLGGPQGSTGAGRRGEAHSKRGGRQESLSGQAHSPPLLR